MIHPLQLRYRPAPDLAPDAWFLPGAEVSRWLDELVRAGLAVADTRLYLVPRSVADRRAAGLLAVPPGSRPASPPPGGTPCRLRAGRLFVPADAILYPALTDDELRRLLPLPVSFYHPAFGLSGFDEASALRVSDLLQAPGEQPSHWNFARTGPPPMPELAAIVLAEPPALETIFGDAQDDIGSEPLADLPPSPDEPAENPAAKARRKLRRIIAQRVADALGKMPHTAGEPNWLNHVEGWANRQLRGVGSELDRLRHKEIHRLLHLLETDPETGLRQAIPMNHFPHRGTAPPSARLGPRPLDFDPSRLGGRPADFWNIPLDLHEALRRRYREMADRELHLGRYRRAAYIYAELLGDLVSAANVFRQGKLFREAALLYEEHLGDPLQAARCLADGGLLPEAAERYEKLGRWLEVADLQERAGNPAAAAQALRRVVNDRLAQGDVLGAAKLVEQRLKAPGEALALLLDAWPASFQAVQALAAAFQLLARLGRHDAALDRLARLQREPVPEPLAPPLVSTLAVTAREYPDERVRHQAADFSRVLISRQLQRPGFSADEAQRLLEWLVRLAPQDRLLTRDVNRYVAGRRAAELRTRRPAPPPLPGKRPTVRRSFELPRQIQWLRLCHEWHWFFALGVTLGRMTIVRGVWEGEFQSLSWDCPGAALKHEFVFEPTAERGRAIAVARAVGPPFPVKRFPVADVLFNQECGAGTPPWLPQPGYPFAFGEDVLWSVPVLTNGRVVLSCHDKSRGRLERTIDVTNELLAGVTPGRETRLSLAVMDNAVAVAWGNRLVLTNDDGTLTRVELPGQITGLVPTLPNTRRGVAVLLNQGAVMYWRGGKEYIELDRDLRSPLAAFIPAGPLVLASDSRVHLYEVNSHGLQSVSRLELPGQRVAGVSGTAAPGEFAVLSERGHMTLFRQG